MIQGLRDTSNFVADGRPKHWRAGILLKYPNGETPLFALSAALKSESVDDPEYNWWEKDMQVHRFALTASLDANPGTQMLTIAAGGLSLKEGDILYAEHTGEFLYVVSDPVSATSVQVQRGFGGEVAPTALTWNNSTTNPNLLLVGSAYEEGSAAPAGRAYNPVKLHNFTQIFRNTFEHTRTASKTRLRTGDDVKEAKRECLELHSRDIERAFFLGTRAETTRNGKPLRMTGGLRYFIPAQNKINVPSGELSLDLLDQYMEQIFRYGSTEKMAFCGARALTALNQAVRKNSHYQVYAGESVYGMKVVKVQTPYGVLVFKNHPLFNQLPGSAAAAPQTFFGMNSTAVVLDMARLKYRYFSGDDTRFESKLEDNGIDGMKSGFLTECGLEVHDPESHFWIRGLNEGIADT